MIKTKKGKKPEISELAKTLNETCLILKKIKGSNDLLEITRLILDALQKFVDESAKSGRKKILFQGGVIFIRGGGKLSEKESKLLKNLNATIQNAIEALNA